MQQRRNRFILACVLWALLAAFLFALPTIVNRLNTASSMRGAYADADTLSEIVLYRADNAELYVHILAESEMNTGGFTDYSDMLLHPENYDLGDTAPATAHEEALYLILPYTEDAGDWRLGMAEDVTLELGGETYHSGDRIRGLADAETYAVCIYGDDGTVRESGEMTVRYNGDVPVLFCEAEDVEAYNTIRTQKHVDAPVDWYCLDAEGNLDSRGDANMSGHGNSTYVNGNKKPLNLRLDAAQSILGMGAVEKYVLLANSMDASNLKDLIVYEAARRMGMEDTPECQLVTYYVNGEYEGLYLLSQKVDITRGCIQGEDDLDQDAKEINGADYPSFEGRIGDKDGEYPYGYYDVARTPANHTGAYLMELMWPGYNSNFLDDPYHATEVVGPWFATDALDMVIRSPRYASQTEVEYIRAYVLEAEDALYAADGVNPETGKEYDEYYDVTSWGQLILLEDFFSLQDYSMGSIFVLKRRDDDLLYAGPIWDYDKALTDGYWDRDSVQFDPLDQAGLGFWMYQFSIKDEIREEMQAQYVQQLSDIMHELNEVDIPAWMSMIASAAATDNLRWGVEDGYAALWAGRVQEWCALRTAFYDSVWVDGKVDDARYNVDNVWPKEVDQDGNEVIWRNLER